ncbi:MAG: hypothetical protein V1735_00765 [Nanoarchaeota archaeon]
MVSATKLSKHDRYVMELCHRIGPQYDLVRTHVPLSRDKRRIAEIDVYACKGDHTDIFEVKCSHRIHKAEKQLRRVKNILHLRNASCFFYCGSSGALVPVGI